MASTKGHLIAACRSRGHSPEARHAWRAHARLPGNGNTGAARQCSNSGSAWRQARQEASLLTKRQPGDSGPNLPLAKRKKCSGSGARRAHGCRRLDAQDSTFCRWFWVAQKGAVKECRGVHVSGSRWAIRKPHTRAACSKQGRTLARAPKGKQTKGWTRQPRVEEGANIVLTAIPCSCVVCRCVLAKSSARLQDLGLADMKGCRGRR